MQPAIVSACIDLVNWLRIEFSQDEFIRYAAKIEQRFINKPSKPALTILIH